MGRILEVGLSTKKIDTKSLDENLAKTYVGGRGFTSRLQFDDLKPDIDPLGPDNPLFIATGPLTGTIAPSSCRYVTAGRSPLTGVLGDSNSGGHWGPELKRAGYDMVIVRGQSSKPVYLWIDDDHVEIRGAAALWGKDVRETDKRIKEELKDSQVQIAIIGQGGENLVAFAGIVSNLDHLCGRTGMGALMGSKRLKAVAVRGTKEVPLADRSRFMKAVGEMMEILKTDLQSSVTLPKYGTTYLVDHHNTIGGMATRNWQTGVFDEVEKINGDAFRNQFFVRNIACWACPYPCDRYSVVKEGEYKGSHCVGPEYFSIVSFGSKPGVSNASSIVRANELCNMYGLDTASTGGIIAFAMECFEKGLLKKDQVDGLDLSWGNYKSMLALIDMIAFRKGFGDTLAKGIKSAVEHIGGEADRFAIHVKGMDSVTLDPRALKVYNFRYAVASRGADHLRVSCPAAYGLDTLPIPEAVKQLKFWQDIVCIPDMMGICKFPWNFFSGSPDIIKTKLLKIVPELYSAATGWEVTGDDLLKVSERVATTERATNIRLGLRRKDDRLPRRYLEEPLPEGPKKGQVHDIFEPLLDAWYEVHGWDVKTGIPKRKRLEKLGLSDIAEELKPIYEKEEVAA